MLSRQLPAAYDELKPALVPQLQEDDKTDAKLVADGEAALASAKYYLTWLMRLEGKPGRTGGARDRWLAAVVPHVGRKGAATRKVKRTSHKHEEDLEAAVRLARLDLSELQALPLPSQCQGSQSGQCKCKGKGKSQKQPKGKSDARGASSGPPPDEHGN